MVGDTVPISRAKGIFEKGSESTYTEEIFKINRIILRADTQIAMIVNTAFPSFEYLRPAIPQKKNGVHCGYFAIAYAFATGRVLKKVNFDVDRIRDHGEDCLRNRKLVPFPGLSEEVLEMNAEQKLTTQVHCSC